MGHHDGRDMGFDSLQILPETHQILHYLEGSLHEIIYHFSHQRTSSYTLTIGEYPGTLCQST
jgi:hypothetical protein